MQSDTTKGGDATLAVDGSMTSYSSTTSANASWELDLGGEYVIKNVTINGKYVTIGAVSGD
ncbi:hypothetical protein DPMN_104547 [Dreissena polymorpha]|uniref:Uncharacterized protein n=1 Tax=Dreissena polymorpha TaxID=45954 RepID=A0A9D4HBT5_DREPO|nr:hypothetical protein DPMN_104547 [Dreissena polymorpha]